jgi:regulator of nonsense transcripts 2
LLRPIATLILTFLFPNPNPAQVISALHQRFSSSFTEPFIQQFLSGLALPNKQYLAGLAPEQREREENSRIIRQRSLLRCLAEFDLVGLVRGSSKQGTSNLEDGETTFVVLKDLVNTHLSIVMYLTHFLLGSRVLM